MHACTVARALWHAVGSQLERGVRLHSGRDVRGVASLAYPYVSWYLESRLGVARSEFMMQILPLVLRGTHLDQQTQVGWYGTPLQLLNQQGRIADGASWALHPNNSLLYRLEIRDGSFQGPCKPCSPDLACSECLDE